MLLVTLDGGIMAPGIDFDYIIDSHGKPIFHEPRKVFEDSVVQVIDTETSIRRIFKGPDLVECSVGILGSGGRPER